MRALPRPSHARSNRFARDLDDPATTRSEPVVLALRSLGERAQGAPLGPDPEFRDALRQRLVAVATVAEAPAPEPTRRGALLRLRGGRGSVLAAGSTAAIVAIAGAGVAGARSLPGDAFYSLKRGSEVVGLRLAGSPLERAELQLGSATTRLDEIESLLARSVTALSPLVGGGVLAAGPPQAAGLPERLASTFADMDQATVEGKELITEAFRVDRDPAPLELLVDWSGEQATRLDALLPELPVAVQPAAESSLRLVEDSGTEAEELLAGVCLDECAEHPVGEIDVVCDCPPVPPGDPGRGDGEEAPVTKAGGVPPSAPAPPPPALPGAVPGEEGSAPAPGPEAGGPAGAAGSGAPERSEAPPAAPRTRNERTPAPALPKWPTTGERAPLAPRTPPPPPTSTTVPLPGSPGLIEPEDLP